MRPLLFLLYINDLPKILPSGKCLLFADDTGIHLGRNNVKDAYSDIQQDLDAVYIWCNDNQTRFDQPKTEYIYIYETKYIIPQQL